MVPLQPPCSETLYSHQLRFSYRSFPDARRARGSIIRWRDLGLRSLWYVISSDTNLLEWHSTHRLYKPQSRFSVWEVNASRWSEGEERALRAPQDSGPRLSYSSLLYSFLIKHTELFCVKTERKDEDMLCGKEVRREIKCLCYVFWQWFIGDAV